MVMEMVGRLSLEFDFFYLFVLPFRVNFFMKLCW